MIRLTAEQAQQIEEALFGCKPTVISHENWNDVYKARAVITAARAQEQAEQEPVGYIDAGDLRELSNGNERQYSLFAKDKGRMVAIYAAPVCKKDLTDIEDLQDAVTKALKKAFHLGQTYWQQADSESYAANKRAADSLDLYRKLEDDTRAVIAADREKNK